MESDDIICKISQEMSPLGFECYAFKVGWYNAQVKDVFKLSYSEDTLAIIMVSTPSMYEKALKPFIVRRQCLGIKDPIDECMAHHFNLIKQDFKSTCIDILLDYELDHNRRPKILVQTAGHVAGAVRYYQREDITDDPWTEKQKIFGVSIHPHYGGWFAFRGVFVFNGILAPNLDQTEPPDPVPDNTDRIELLSRFNFHWQDSTFRDIIMVSEKYSAEQKLYFDTKPKDRHLLVKKIQDGSGTYQVGF